jgi:FtsH-binding integral membrane protein
MVNSSLYNRFIAPSQHSLLNQKGGRKMPKIINATNMLALVSDRKQFFLLTFLNLIFQLGITYYLMMTNKIGTDSKENELRTIYGIFVLQLILIIVLALVPMPSFLKFIVFTIFSVLTGILLSVVKTGTTTDIIKTAIISTMAIFGTMLMFGVALIIFGIQLSYKFGLVLLISLLFLIIARIATMLLGTYSTISKGITIFSLFLFSIYILYDTNTILQRNYEGDFITASIDYYLDIINLFINLVSFGTDRN